MKEKYLGFRGWFYLRQGWANYLTFVMASVNTLTVTYFLAIERYPFLMFSPILANTFILRKGETYYLLILAKYNNWFFDHLYSLLSL